MQRPPSEYRVLPYTRPPTRAAATPTTPGFRGRPPTYAVTTLRIPGSSVHATTHTGSGHPYNTGFQRAAAHLCSDHPQNSTGFIPTATTQPGSDHPQQRQLYSSVMYLAIVDHPRVLQNQHRLQTIAPLVVVNTQLVSERERGLQRRELIRDDN